MSSELPGLSGSAAPDVLDAQESPRRLQDQLRHMRAEVFELIARDEPLRATLDALVRLAEAELDGLRGAILLSDADNTRLFLGAAPSLPAGRQADGPWTDFRDMARAHGVHACWSTPIVAHSGRVVGTFALHAAAPRGPTAEEREVIRIAAHIAGIAIARARSDAHDEFLARHDALTHLPNRLYMNEQLARLTTGPDAAGQPFALALLDLDGFKELNDLLGHYAGDLALQEVARRLREAFRDMAIARLGGDEFALIIPAVEIGALEPVLDAVLEVLRQPISIAGREWRSSASVGVARFPGDAVRPSELLKQADIALYRAKGRGRDCFELFDPAMSAAIARGAMLRQEAAEALRSGGFQLYFQPIIDVRAVPPFLIGFETLLRWRHPELGLLSPAQFMEVFDDTRLAARIGAFVSSQSIAQMGAWRAEGLPFRALSFNITAADLRSQTFPQTLLAAIEAAGVEADRIVIEVTEGMFLGRGSERTLEALSQLYAAGFKIALDDFGTGFASLSHLRDLSITYIKIDRSFITGIATASNSAIIDGVVRIAHSLGLGVGAEGVETPGQLEAVRRLGCDFVQGHLIGEPMPAWEVPAFVARFGQQA
jgi:diguanylate cyclase (GGDEF)-like protein